MVFIFIVILLFIFYFKFILKAACKIKEYIALKCLVEIKKNDDILIAKKYVSLSNSLQHVVNLLVGAVFLCLIMFCSKIIR